MGLDMHLNGRKSFARGRENGKPIAELYALGYWRKHPDLHGYIVAEFADGEDNCQPIFLSTGDIQKIIAAITSKELPHTEGFFFGSSFNDEAQNQEAAANFRDALVWLKAEQDGHYRCIYYQASW